MKDWSVTIMARNEAASIQSCIRSVIRASRNHSVSITILLNGCSDRTCVMSVAAMDSSSTKLYTIPFGDKSNAWNQFVHALAPKARTYFFVDGYAEVAEGSFEILAAALEKSPRLNAATGVPSVGRSAKAQSRRLREVGGLHGSLHALQGTFVARIQEKKLRLPVGLYRGDGLIGSLAMHDLDSLHSPWNPDLVAVCPKATWSMRTLSPWRLGDLHRHFRRRVQQARGAMENEAIKDIIYALGYEGLPEFADSMLLDWIRLCRVRNDKRLGHDLLTQLARLNLHSPRRPEQAELKATLVALGTRTPRWPAAASVEIQLS